MDVNINDRLKYIIPVISKYLPPSNKLKKCSLSLIGFRESDRVA